MDQSPPDREEAFDLEEEALDAWNDWLDDSGLTSEEAPLRVFMAGVEWAEERYSQLLSAARGWRSTRGDYLQAAAEGAAAGDAVEAAFNRAEQSLSDAVAGFDGPAGSDALD